MYVCVCTHGTAVSYIPALVFVSRIFVVIVCLHMPCFYLRRVCLYHKCVRSGLCCVCCGFCPCTFWSDQSSSDDDVGCGPLFSFGRGWLRCFVFGGGMMSLLF